MSLDEVFNPSAEGEVVEQETETTSEQVEEVEVSEKPTEEASKPEPKEDAEKAETDGKAKDESKEIDYNDLPDWAIKRLKDDRQKAKEAREELEAYKAKLEQPEAERPSVFDDEKGFTESLKNDVKQELRNYKLEMSREMMMELKSDYADIEQYVLDAAKEDVSFANFVRSEAVKHNNPAKFIYEQGIKLQEFKKMQDVDSYKERLRAEIRADLEKEFKAEVDKKANVSDITPSLAKARASEKEAPIDDSLESMFAR